MDSLLLSCRALSSPTTCRFIPAHLRSRIARFCFTNRFRVCCNVILLVDCFSANGEQCLNHLCQPRGQAQGHSPVCSQLSISSAPNWRQF